ncbi:MAG: hypothetical protein M1828_006704 [Chrysothrix sp. TS-e1954]|nr:MAG: hypothetical protein M1828_006704 [Chrysothrix sp. TS-e1954]
MDGGEVKRKTLGDGEPRAEDVVGVSVKEGMPNPGRVDDTQSSAPRRSSNVASDIEDVHQENEYLRSRLNRLLEAVPRLKATIRAASERYDIIWKHYSEQRKEILRQEVFNGKLRTSLQEEAAVTKHFKWMMKTQDERFKSEQKRYEYELEEKANEQARMEIDLRDAQVAGVDREQLQRSLAEQTQQIEQLRAERASLARIQESQAENVLEMQRRLDESKLKKLETSVTGEISKEALQRTYETQVKQIEDYRKLLEDTRFKEAETISVIEFRYGAAKTRLKEENELLRQEIERLTSSLERSERNDTHSNVSALEPLSRVGTAQSTHTEGGEALEQTRQEPPKLHRMPVLDVNVPGGIPRQYRGIFITEGSHNHEMLIKLLLIRCKIALAGKDYLLAEDAALEATRVAELIENIPIMARCAYWRGRAELATGQHLNAVYSFELAGPCAGRYVEAEDLQNRVYQALEQIPSEHKAEDVKPLSKELAAVQQASATTATSLQSAQDFYLLSPRSRTSSHSSNDLEVDQQRKSQATDLDQHDWSPDTPSALSESGQKSAQLARLEREEALSKSPFRNRVGQGVLQMEKDNMIVSRTPVEQNHKKPQGQSRVAQRRSLREELEEADSDSPGSVSAPSPRLDYHGDSAHLDRTNPIQQRRGRAAGRRRVSQQLSVDLQAHSARVDHAEEYIKLSEEGDVEHDHAYLSPKTRRVSVPHLTDQLPDEVSRTISEGQKDLERGLTTCYSISSPIEVDHDGSGPQRPASAPFSKPAKYARSLSNSVGLRSLAHRISPRPKSSHSDQPPPLYSASASLSKIEETDSTGSARGARMYDNDALGETY